MEIPCKNCLLIPLCRNKTMKELSTDCSLIDAYMMNSKNKIALNSRQAGKQDLMKQAVMRVMKVRMFLDKEYKNG